MSCYIREPENHGNEKGACLGPFIGRAVAGPPFGFSQLTKLAQEASYA